MKPKIPFFNIGQLSKTISQGEKAAKEFRKFRSFALAMSRSSKRQEKMKVPVIEIWPNDWNPEKPNEEPGEYLSFREIYDGIHAVLSDIPDQPADVTVASEVIYPNSKKLDDGSLDIADVVKIILKPGQEYDLVGDGHWNVTKRADLYKLYRMLCQVGHNRYNYGAIRLVYQEV